MCGISGAIVTKYDRNVDDFIRSSFVAGSLRGMDSSGIAQIYDGGETFDTHKLPISGMFFIGDKAASEMIRHANQKGTATICHTRAATTGGVNRNTAHPFECYSGKDGMLVGVHNGTLQNWKNKPDANKYEVDSEWALNHILKEKFDAFEDFQGAYCFVWWDADTQNNLNIARNAERPMHVVMLKSGGMAYASEAGMLYWLLERHDVEMDGPIMELDAGYWYRFPLDAPAKFTKTKLPEEKKVVSHPASRYASYPSTYVSTMNKFRKLFKKEPEQKQQPLLVPEAPVSAKNPAVSQEQHKVARDLGWLGEIVEFSPLSAYAGVVEGQVDFMNSAVAGRINIDEDSEQYRSINWDDVWLCPIIGAEDDGQEFTLILGTPKLKDSKKAA